MSKRSILIKNGCIITGEGHVFENGFVYVRDGIVLSIGDMSRSPRTSGVRIIDAKGAYVTPGLINPHMHLYSYMARGLFLSGNMKTFGGILKNLWWRLDEKLSLEDIYISAVLGLIDALKSGVTSVVDHHASYGAIKGSLAEICGAFMNVGLRGSICFEASDRHGKRVAREALNETIDMLDGISADFGGGIIRGMVGLHASMTLSDEALSNAVKIMDGYGVGAHVHIAEGIEDVGDAKRRYSKSPVKRFFDAGILREGTLAVHCVHIDASDISILKRSGTFVIHNPMSNLNNAVGFAPVGLMHKKGIPVAIGTDGMSAGVANDIRLASVLHKSFVNDARTFWNETMRSVWNVAPRIMSGMFDTDIGTLKKGAAGDIVIFDSVPPTPVNASNAWAHFLFGVLNSRARTVVVDGKLLMEDFVPSIADEKIIARKAMELSKKLWKKL